MVKGADVDVAAEEEGEEGEDEGGGGDESQPCVSARTKPIT